MLVPVSALMLLVIMFWMVYHLPILCAGISARFTFVSLTDRRRSVESPKVSLVVPAKNEAVFIGRCLEALLDLDYPRDMLEIIVVDGRSTDGTFEISEAYAQKYPDIIRVLRQEVLSGKPSALNEALPYASGEIVGFFDADSVPNRDALGRVAAYFSDDSVVAVQGRVYPLNERGSMLTKVAAKERRAWSQFVLQGREQLGLFVPLTGSCQFVRRDVLEEAGGWREDALAEDVELALRLAERGYRVRYAYDIGSGEEMPLNLESLVKQRGRWYRGYMEASVRYGRLLRRPTRRNIDAEILLMGPLVMVTCLVSYLNWAIGLFFPRSNIGLLLDPMMPAVGMTALALLTIGLGLVFMDRPICFRNLRWIPFVYAYWFIQTVIAGWALLQILLRRPHVWQKTVKTVSPSMGIGRSIGGLLG